MTVNYLSFDLEHYGPGVDSASNRNEYQEYFLGGKGGRRLRVTTLPPLCADCLEIYEPQPPGNIRASSGPQWDSFTFTLPLTYRGDGLAACTCTQHVPLTF
jgi:hypothetical protein